MINFMLNPIEQIEYSSILIATPRKYVCYFLLRVSLILNSYIDFPNLFY